MHIWTDLLTREAAMLALLLALGAAPAAFLSERFDVASRLALAPALGFSLGTCVATTVLQAAPAQDTFWMLVPLAALSLGIATWRRRRPPGRATGGRITVRDGAQLLVVCLAVTTPLNVALHERHTVGPAAFTYTDVDNYVGEQDGARTISIGDARSKWTHAERTGARFADLTAWDWSFFADFNANPNAAPLDANLNALLGLGATDTNSSFLIVMLLMGALGAFAAVRYVTQSSTWTAVLSGALFAGPFFTELWFDTFEAAIMALGLLMPLTLAGAEAIRTRRPPDIVVTALIVGCLLTVYPVLVPIVSVAAVLIVSAGAVLGVRQGHSLRSQALTAAVPIGAFAALVLAFTNVSFIHALGYYRKLLEDKVPLPRVTWHLPPEILPGWLLQTREFWYMPALGAGGTKQFLLALVIPLVLIAVIVVAVRKHRFAAALVVFAGVCAIFAEYAYKSRSACTYCAERDLLPIAPVAAVLLGIGLAALLAIPSRWMRLFATAVAALAVLTVGQRTRIELKRFVNDSYFLDSAARSTLAHLPSGALALQLEGFGETLSAQAEQPLVYYMADERLPNRTSIILGSDLYGALEYLDFGVVKPPGPEFHPDYDFVLTRFAGIHTGRRTVARSGAIALQRRTRPLDVITYSGLAAPLARLDGTGTAWVQPQSPLQLLVVGSAPGPAWAKLTFQASEPVSVTSRPGTRVAMHGGSLVVCARSTGTAPIRSATVQLIAPTAGGPAVVEDFPPPTPQENIKLTGMQAVAGDCKP